MTERSSVTSVTTGGSRALSSARLRKHADYQRVYRRSRKHFSTSMTYFFADRASNPPTGPRVGLTAGRVLGKAVERNRIKRRMREAVRLNLALLTRDVDVVLHPRRTVLTAEFGGLQSEVCRIFAFVEKAAEKASGRPDPKAGEKREGGC
jgi:ribonuclease P protein component